MISFFSLFLIFSFFFVMDSWFESATVRPAPTLPPGFFDRKSVDAALQGGDGAGGEPTTETVFVWREAASAVLEGVGEEVEEGEVDVWLIGTLSVVGAVAFGVCGAWAFKRATGRSM